MNGVPPSKDSYLVVNKGGSGPATKESRLLFEIDPQEVER
jgi:hypothetical protein